MAKKQKLGSLGKGLNRRLTLRTVLLFLLLDAAFFFIATIWLDAYLYEDDIALILLLAVAVELVFVVVSALQNAGLIKKTLRPLADLSTATARLSDRAAATQGGLSHLAGQLEGIDAGRLDYRLPMEGPAELQELTGAINAMLERLDEAYAAQSRFVSDASHELRTPISVIRGYANLLNRWGKDDPKARQEAIDAIVAESEAMEKLVEQLLFLAREDNHTTKLALETIDATDVATQVLRETALIDKTHPLRADWTEGVSVTADPGLLKEGLRVLVDNACKYTPAGGQVTLRVRAQAGQVRFTVSDEGEGISKDDLPHLFDRFYRADASRTRKTGGTGLGLAIARGIAQQHGGYLEVESCPGLGSRFTLVLPQARPS